MPPNALVLVFDRLGSGYLGPYGNTWIDTPAWNRLAAQATLFETALADSPRLQTLYDSYWYGHHALALPAADPSPALPHLLGAQQIETWLVTDERQLAQRADAQGFSHRVVLPPGDAQTAESLTETQLARLFATLVDVLHQATPPFMIWVHAQAMQGPWDAPYAWRLQLADEEDPEPPTAPEPPELLLDDDADPDLLLGLQQAYGAQVLVLDACLEILLDSLGSSPLADSTALLATAARGYPLGEHRLVGRNQYRLFGELLQVPWLIAGPAAAGATWRMQQTVQPADMYTTLCRWMGATPAAGVWGRSLLRDDVLTPPSADQLVAGSVYQQQRALRVPGWFLHLDELGQPSLYVKPDDRWEFNEVATRCGQVVEELTALLDQFAEATRAGQRHRLPELGETFQIGFA